MNQEMKEWLNSIEVVDTTPTRERLEAIRQEVKNELENECNHPQGTVCSICSLVPII